jgi:2'-5' RNA ligase
MVVSMEHWEDWQKVYQHGTFVIWPPDDVRDMVNQQREKYDPRSASICEAHITVTQPLLQPMTDAKWRVIQEAISDFVPFFIQYGPLRSFLPYPCIWYEIQPARLVLELRESLHSSGFFNLVDGYIEDFIPHMTITEELSGPKVTEELLGSLQSESETGAFLCDSLAHILPDENFRFTVTKRIRLGQ